ncbi:hypothetical protein VNO77_22854 [Canavalia gladiata]|uniref:Uncharacterized protein n=1 Tax=Canavalia gladiata TaxID=3824 RepID=A0AAN9L3J2_CANGL
MQRARRSALDSNSSIIGCGEKAYGQFTIPFPKTINKKSIGRDSTREAAYTRFWSDASKSSGSFAVSTNCHRIVSLRAALGSGLPKKPIHTKGCINDSDFPYSLLASKGRPQDLMFPWSVIKLH